MAKPTWNAVINKIANKTGLLTDREAMLTAACMLDSKDYLKIMRCWLAMCMNVDALFKVHSTVCSTPGGEHKLQENLRKASEVAEEMGIPMRFMTEDTDLNCDDF